MNALDQFEIEVVLSDLTGHYKITTRAIQELRKETTTSARLGVLPNSVVERDLKDVVSLGHWADFGQKHHFMRPFDASSPYEAYVAAVEWIKTNALEGAERLQWSNQHRATNLGFGVGRTGADGQVPCTQDHRYDMTTPRKNIATKNVSRASVNERM